MQVKDYINLNDAAGYFILDCHKKNSEKHIQKDVDFVNYNYNMNSFNQLKINSLVLFRRPQGSGIDGKFYFYGGAFIKALDINYNSGEINASLKKPFKFTEPLYEDSENALAFRDDKAPWQQNWGKNFWRTYGMNPITKKQFEILIKDVDCEPVGVLHEKDIREDDDCLDIEEKNAFDTPDIDGYELDITDDDAQSKAPVPSKVRVGKHFDYDKLNQEKRTIGKAGEVLVLDFEIEKLAGTPYRPEYIAETKGDGLGYDILSYERDGKEILIEVKTTTSNKKDEFFLSENERCVAFEKPEKYKIYRVFNLNKLTKTADIHIFNDIKNQFDFKPVLYKALLK